MRDHADRIEPCDPWLELRPMVRMMQGFLGFMGAHGSHGRGFHGVHVQVLPGFAR